MCGIVGIINHHAASDAKSLIRRMTNSMVHRGPDGSGEFLTEEVAIGHRRLAVIDLENGTQPIFNEDGTIAVVLNGEIYNYLKLRQELESRGHIFKTQTDTEVLVHLYEELGGECVAMLEGMFAFAIYNSRNRRVLLARDRMGKKPLFYFMYGDTLVFASELETLRQHPQMPRELDSNAVSDFLSLHYIPSPNTIYRNVRKLPPAHQLEFRLNDGTISIRGYWHLDYSLKTEMPFEEAAKELRSLVEKAVEKRLIADVPVGTFLSGGIDSTVITALTTKLRGNQDTDAFTIGFEESAYDERGFATQAAESINADSGGRLRHHVNVVNPCDFSLLEKLVIRSGEPYADASLLPTFLLSEFAKSKITVALSGDGADEMFSGYERYLAMKYARYADVLPRFLRSPLCLTGAACLPDAGERSLSGRLRRTLKLLSERHEERYFKLLDHCPQTNKRQLFGEKLHPSAEHNSAELFEALQWELTAPDRLERLAEMDVHSYLCNDILPKVDTASMAAGLEVRSPFLDKDVVEFAAKLPLEYKLAGNSRKHILKAAFADLVPPAIARRRKKGFGVPVSDWLRGEWSNLAEDAIFDGVLIRDGYFQEKPLRALWRAHQSGDTDAGYLLWGTLILALFLNSNH